MAWAAYAAELDLLVIRGGRRYGFEFKYADAPGRTRSMLIAQEDLGLERLWVIYAGAREYDLGETIRVLPLASAPRVVGALRRA